MPGHAYCREPDDGFDRTAFYSYFDDEEEPATVEEKVETLGRAAEACRVPAPDLARAVARMRDFDEVDAWSVLAVAAVAAGFSVWNSDTRFLAWGPDDAPPCPDCDAVPRRP